MTRQMIIDIFIILMLLASLVVLFDFLRPRCYVCGKRGWTWKMDADCVFGSGPETAEFASRHSTCKPDGSKTE